MSQSHAVKPVGFPPLRLRATVSALRNTSGITTALPRFRTTPPSSSAGSEAARRLKSRWLVAPSAAPSAAGCWWMMAAPTVACTGTGIPPRARAAPRRSAGLARRGCRGASPRRRRSSGRHRGGAGGRGATDRLCWGAARWGRFATARSPPRDSRSWMPRTRVDVLLELELHGAEREIRLQRDHDPGTVVGEPHARVGLFGKDAAAVGDAVAHHDRVPLSPGRAHALATEHFDDHRIALGAEVTVVLIALSLLERHGADPVEERGVVQRIGDRGERAVATGFAVEPGIGVDVEFPLPGLTLLLGLVHEPA